jgi:YggT family protein
MAGLLSVGYFLASLFFSLILFILWIRMILRYFRVSSIHPVGQLIFSLTNPVLMPLERQMYRGQKRLPRYDWICLLAIVVIEFIKFIVLGLITYLIFLPFIYLIILVIADLIVQPCNLLFYALIIRVVLSWVSPQWQQHPLASILILVTDPLIRLGRKVVPDISGFDFSPFIMMVILKVITLFISASVPLPLI